MKTTILILTLLCIASGLYAVDSLNVRLVGRALAGPCFATFTVGDYCYMGGGGRFIVMDVTDPTHPTEVGHCYVTGLIRDIYIVGDYAYVADGDSGLQIIDISTPSAPSLTGTYNTGGSAAHRVDVSGDYAYLVDGSGLRIIDVSMFTGE